MKLMQQLKKLINAPELPALQDDEPSDRNDMSQEVPDHVLSVIFYQTNDETNR